MTDTKLKALHYFIRESTVGELNYIIDDISSILGNKDFMQEPEIVEALRTYYEQHLTHHILSTGDKVVVSQHARQEKTPVQQEGEGDEQAEDKPSEFVYLDQARNSKFTLDVITGQCKIIEGDFKSENEAVQTFKQALVESLDKYIQDFYKENTTLGTVTILGEEQIEAHIEISCHNLKHSNFWGGEWLSRWTLKHTLGSSDFEVTGAINVVNHYFEQGNIQIKLDKNFESVDGAVKDGDAAQSIISKIGQLEENYQASLETMYEDISENHMKSLRRKLPFTGKTFDWGVPKLM